MSNLIFIIGPTATGKSEVAYRLALKSGAEIVSCDSMLVYKEPSIITSKPSLKILAEVTHHFVNIISVEEMYDVFSYYEQAKTLINQVYAKGVPPVE